jgi:hypothetical protein
VKRPVVLELAPGRRAAAIELGGEDEVAAAVDALALHAPRPTLVVVGGAAGLSEAEHVGLTDCAGGLAQAASDAGAVIVDGGTDAGVMRLLGLAHAECSAAVPLVGVVVRALAAMPGEEVVPPAAALEPNHTHFVLVPGSSWGEEAPWIARVAAAVAGDRPSVTVLVNGGEIAWTDAAESVRAGRTLLAVRGTGRTAEAVAAAADGRAGDERADALVRTGLVEAVSLGEDAAPSLHERVREILEIAEPAGG